MEDAEVLGTFLQPLICTILDIQKVLFRFMAVRNEWSQTDQQLDKEFVQQPKHNIILIFDIH